MVKFLKKLNEKFDNPNLYPQQMFLRIMVT